MLKLPCIQKGRHFFYCMPVAGQPNAFWTLSRTLLLWARLGSLNSDLVAWPGCSGAALTTATPNDHGDCTAQHGEYVHGHLHGSKKHYQLRLHVFLKVKLLLLERFCKIRNLLWMVPSHEEHGGMKICSVSPTSVNIERSCRSRVEGFAFRNILNVVCGHQENVLLVLCALQFRPGLKEATRAGLQGRLFDNYLTTIWQLYLTTHSVWEGGRKL